MGVLGSGNHAASRVGAWGRDRGLADVLAFPLWAREKAFPLSLEEEQVKKVLVIGLDGLDPGIVEAMLNTGSLPALAKLRQLGGYARVQTTCPAQTPVAWSTFVTGMNPGGHGIFDFIRRDPKTYCPDLSFNRYEQKNSFLPPRVVNRRSGTPVWERLSTAGIPSTILRCPCTYPPDNIRGRMLAGMGVPDLRGSLGTSTFYTTSESVVAGAGESIVPIRPDSNGTVVTGLLGPRNPRTREHFTVEIVIQPGAGAITVQSAGQPPVLTVWQGKWSDWLKVKFKTGLLQSVRGMVRFYLVRTAPALEFYVSPINFDPEHPLFPISSPPEYAGELAARIGTFYTTGMVEDYDGLMNGRLDEAAFLAQCDAVLRERERMMQFELERFREGMFFCLFDTPDRLQHMFWRFREPEHPANRGAPATEWAQTIEEHYRACDAIVGRALELADQETLAIVLSDHGFNSFQRGVSLNTWLHEQGLLALRDGAAPGEEAGDFLRHVDWSRTKAYSLGLSGIYLNLKGREEQGLVSADEAPELKTALAEKLTGLVDPVRGRMAVRGVKVRELVYHGPCTALAPDLIVNCAAGYRISWGTALGGVPRDLFEDNIKRWGGDHIIDPSLVPGVLFMNRPFDTGRPRLVDLAPTILTALGLSSDASMEGTPLLP
jgi:predicted AlkP superfamily phosphohydrolase/phosphomutase